MKANTRRAVRIVALASGVVGALWLLGGCARPHETPTSSAISLDDLKFYVRFLADGDLGGRSAGTPGGRRASAFVADEHKKNGLVPAFDGSYFQQFPFSVGEVSVSASGNTLDFSAGPKKVHAKVVPLPLSAAGQFEGPLVFGGYCLAAGKKYDDISDLVVKDSVVVCMRFGPGGKSNEALREQMAFVNKVNKLAKQGARAIIFLGRTGHSAPAPNMFGVRHRSGPGAVFLEGKQLLEAFPKLARANEFALKDLAIPKDLRGPLGAEASIRTDFEQRRMQGRNVGAYLRKPRQGERVLIVGAHLDHIGHGEFSSLRGAGRVHPGADDNASGSAVLLELAASLRVRFPEGFGNTNVLFLHFDAEEHGLYGSRAFVKSPFFSAAQTLAMINMDMVGRVREERGLSAQGFDTADARLKELLSSSFAKAGFGKVPLKLRPGGRGPSDHTTFYDKKVPVVFIHSGTHPDYHTADDVANRINYDGLMAVLRFCDALTVGVAQLRSPLAFQESKARSRSGSVKLKVRLGIVPADYGGDQGVEVGSVNSDAPIAKTGLQAGDRIVEIEGRKITDIHDLMDFLSDANASQEYTFAYVRGQTKHSAKTKLLTR